MRLKLALAAATLSCTSALAADLAPAPIDPGAPVSWTGFYAGANAGYGWGTTNVDDNYTAPPPATFSYSNKPSNFIGGIQVGYNYQVGQMVIGAEADIDYFHDKKLFYLFDNAPFFPVTTTYNALGTARLRAGYAFENALVYATGGLAVADVTDNFTNNAAGLTFKKSGLRVGWTVGGGLEYAIDNHWSFKTEYLYTKLQDTDLDRSFPLGDIKWKHDLQTVRFGINYRF